MIRMVQRRLIIPRGDTGSFSIPYLKKINQGDVAVFTIFDVMTHTKLFQKVVAAEGDVLNIAFSHNETVNLQPGKYLWDIKIYTNPQFVDDKLVNGEEIDSYYAGFSLPECEIRETGDSLLMSDDTPQAKLAPDQIDLISAAITATQTAKEVAMNSATDAETSASAAASSAQVALDSKDAALASQTSAATSESNAAESAAAAQVSATRAAQIAQQIHEEIPTKVSDLVDDSGHYTKPVTGIPASDLEETYVKFDDYATTTTAGVVKVGGLGIRIRDGEIQLSPASDRQIKVNSGDNSPIVASKGNQAAFYGLANAAGDTTQSQSTNPVGQYTDAAKAAIQAMLDVPSTADIPTNVSELTNDAGYLTQHQDISGKANSADLAAVATSGSYEDLEDKPTIPDIQIAGMSIVENGIADIPIASGATAGVVKVSNGTFGLKLDNSNRINIQSANSNDVKFGSHLYKPIIPSNQHEATFFGLSKAAGVDLANEENITVGTYPDSAKTAIQTMLDVPSNAAMNTAIGTAIGNINSFDMAVVQELPSQDISTHTIYLVPKTGETNDVYDEYVYINGNWEMVGNTQVDLSNYVTFSDIATRDNAGIAKYKNEYGLYITNNGYAAVYYAPQSAIKRGTEEYRPIVPANQHQSIFYGLAKVAGDTTQASSSNKVGTYTTEAKASIQTMLDVPSNADLALKADKTDTVLETTLSRGRKDNTTVGGASLAFGVNTEASGYYSVALGLNTTASSQGAFAEGKNTVARYIAHAEGEDTQALGQWAHSQGVGTIAKGAASFAGGDNTIANGHSSFVTGRYNAADSYDNWAFWAANTSYAVGDKVKREQLVNNEPTIIGYICKEANTDETFDISHWDFDSNHMNYSVIVGNGYEAEDPETHQVVRHGSNAYALDWDGTAHYAGDVYVNANADSTGGSKVAKDDDVAVVLGTAAGSAKTKDFTVNSNTYINVASGIGSFAEGNNSIASGNGAHAEGAMTTASAACAHAEGYATQASGQRAHAEGQYTKAASYSQHVQGKYNIEDSHDTYADIVGNGLSVNSRSNAYALEWTGTGRYAGDVYVGCNNDSTGGTKVLCEADFATAQDIQNIINGGAGA